MNKSLSKPSKANQQKKDNFNFIIYLDCYATVAALGVVVVEFYCPRYMIKLLSFFCWFAIYIANNKIVLTYAYTEFFSSFLMLILLATYFSQLRPRLFDLNIVINRILS